MVSCASRVGAAGVDHGRHNGIGSIQRGKNWVLFFHFFFLLTIQFSILGTAGLSLFAFLLFHFHSRISSMTGKRYQKRWEKSREISTGKIFKALTHGKIFKTPTHREIFKTITHGKIFKTLT